MPRLLTRAKYTPSTIDEANRSVECVLASGNPVNTYIPGMGNVDEILNAEGAEHSDSIPLLNCHDRWDLDKVLGSVRDFKIENNTLIGRLYFADTEEGKKAFELIRQGHLTTGSVGYEHIETVWIPEGQKGMAGGKEYDGPVLLTSRWKLDEFSLTPVPADPNAIVRGKNDNNTVVDENISIKELEIMPNKIENVLENNAQNTGVVEAAHVDNSEIVERAKKDAAAEACKREKARISAINEVCEKFGCKELATRAIREDLTIEQTNKLVLEELATRSKAASSASSIQITADERDKFINAASDGLLLRAGLKVENPAAGAEEFRGFGYETLARKVLQRSGNTQVLGKLDTLGLVMRAGAQGYDDFANILDDGVKKAVRIGYKNAPSTWKLWAQKGSLDDLEPTKRTGLTDIPAPALYTEGSEIEYTTIGDEGEQVKLDTYANKLVLTRRAILADNMNLFSQIAQIIGRRCAQKAESLAYGVLTANANMSDNTALFHASHGNLLSGGVLSKDTLAAAYAAMIKQTDANGTKLGLIPRYLIVSPDDAQLAEVLCTAQNDVSSVFTLGNTNFFKNHGLIAISSPFLEQSGGFFLACDPADGATVEVDFLDGREGPTIEISDNDRDILSRSWKYWFDVGAKAVDFRGLNKTPYSAG